MDELLSVRMLDTNSDGQVSADEIIDMVTHPDPSTDDFFSSENLTTNENDDVEGEGASILIDADI